MSAETFMGIRIKAAESILRLVLITDPVIGMGNSVYEVEGYLLDAIMVHLSCLKIHDAGNSNSAYHSSA